MKQKTGIFDIINVILLTVASIVCIYPMIYILFASFSDPAELIKYNGVLFKPLGFSTAGYKEVLHNKTASAVCYSYDVHFGRYDSLIPCSKRSRFTEYPHGNNSAEPCFGL